MNNQDVFNKVAKHLLTQKRKALNNSQCVYLNYNGDKCAIGCLIPSDHQASRIKGGVSTLFAHYPDIYEIIFGKKKNDDLNYTNNYDFLVDLQLTHDNNEVKIWKHKLKEIASKFQLEWNDALEAM